MGVETGSFFVGTFGASVDCWSAIALGTVALNKDATACRQLSPEYGT